MLQNIGIKKAWACTHSRNGNETNARNKKPFPLKMNATVLILVWLQNSDSDIQLSDFSWYDSTS